MLPLIILLISAIMFDIYVAVKFTVCCDIVNSFHSLYSGIDNRFCKRGESVNFYSLNNDEVVAEPCGGSAILSLTCF
jgi:hypothetical protein